VFLEKMLAFDEPVLCMLAFEDEEDLLVQTSAKSGHVHARIHTPTHKCCKNLIRTLVTLENEAAEARMPKPRQKIEEDLLVFESDEDTRGKICKIGTRTRAHRKTKSNVIRALVTLENEATKSLKCPNLVQN